MELQAELEGKWSLVRRLYGLSEAQMFFFQRYKLNFNDGSPAVLDDNIQIDLYVLEIGGVATRTATS